VNLIVNIVSFVEINFGVVNYVNGLIIIQHSFTETYPY